VQDPPHLSRRRPQIFVGEVLRLRHDPEDRPLLFYRGKYHGVGPNS
jgi:flavin reductase (DIM6/NTAB) family NADH-FMN oxidoreductase RutF